MNWHLILKSDTLWNKLSDRIVELNEVQAYNIFALVLTHARRVVRGTKRLPSKKEMTDDCYKYLSDKAFRLFAFYNVFELYNEQTQEKVARRLLPDEVLDVEPLVRKRVMGTNVDSLYELNPESQEIAKFKNFEGYVVYKTTDRSSAYADEPKYRVDYYSKGFLFYIDLMNAMEYKKFLKEKLVGQTILESRQTRRENFPWRKIRARGR